MLTMPIGKQTKDSYPNKLTGCQKKTKNPLFYVVGERGGTKQTKKKQKNKSKIKSSTVSILSLETAVNHEGRQSSDPRLGALRPFSAADMLVGPLWPPMVLTMGSTTLSPGWHQTA